MNQSINHINDDLLLKYLLGEATIQEQQMVNAWLYAAPENLEYYKGLQKLWEMSRLPSVRPVNEMLAWQRFREKIQPGSPVLQSSRQSRRWLQIAAMVVLIAGASVFFMLSKEKDAVESWSAYTADSVRQNTLPDGSLVTLNKNSTLAYESGEEKERKVRLRGEAFFDVKPDMKRPFIIAVNDVQVKVTGTSFNVKGKESLTEVIVESGSVLVYKAGDTVLLRAGEKVTAGLGKQLKKEAEESNLYNYYKSKKFLCNQTPLWKLVETLNEAYGVQIVIANDAHRELPLTTTFSNESLENILNIICQTFSLTTERKNDIIYLK